MAVTYYHADTGGSGTAPYDTWAKAINTADILESVLESTITDSDILYIKSNFTETGSHWDCNANDGTAILPITIIGVKAATTNEGANVTFADWADANMSGGADDRPTIAMGAYIFTTGDYWKLCNIILTGTATSVIVAGASCTFFNCKSTNSSGTPTRIAFNGGAYTFIINCEGISTNGTAFTPAGSSRVLFSYAHDSSIGLAPGGNAIYILFNIFDTCTTGLSLAGTDIHLVFNNVFYNSTTVVSATDSYSDQFINNIIDTATDAFVWTTQSDINFFWRNHEGNDVTRMYDTTTNKVASTEGSSPIPHTDPAVSTGDPLFDGAAGGDFSLAAGSPCLNNALSPTLGT